MQPPASLIFSLPCLYPKELEPRWKQQGLGNPSCIVSEKRCIGDVLNREYRVMREWYSAARYHWAASTCFVRSKSLTTSEGWARHTHRRSRTWENTATICESNLEHACRIIFPYHLLALYISYSLSRSRSPGAKMTDLPRST